MVWWDGWWMSHHCGSCPNRRGGSTPPPLKPLICVSSQPAIQNHPPSLDQPYWPSADDGYRASMQNMGHGFWILVCAVNFWKFVLPVLRIRDVYPGSDFFHPGSRIQGWQDSEFRIRIRIKEHKVLKNKIRDVHPRSRILNLDYFFTSRIPDPGVKKSPDPDPGSGSATLVFTLVE